MDLNSEEARLFAQNIVDTVREALLILDEKLRVVSASRSFYRQFQVEPEETERRLVYELGNGQWDIPALRELLQTIISSQTTIEEFEVRHHFESIGEKVMLLNARRMLRESGKPTLILLAIEDITQRSAVEQKLSDSESKYRMLVEEINSIILRFNHEGNITFFNHFSEKLFGYNREEVLGKPLVGTIVPCRDSSGRDNSIMCREIFSDPAQFYQKESEGIRKDGSHVFFSFSAKPMRDISGAVTEILIDGNDITELARERREAKENSAILKALLDFIPEGIMITDENHVVRKASRYLGELFSVPAEQLIGTDEIARIQMLDLFFPGGERVTGPNDLPLSRAASTGNTYTDLEIISRNNGKAKILSVSAAPIFDNEGKIIGAVGGWRDITENKQMLEAITDLAKFPEENPFPVLRVTSDGVVLYGNKASRELLQGLQCHIDSVLPEKWQDEVRKAFSSGTRKTFDTRCGERVLSLNIVPVVEQGYINIYANDITERRAAEDALRFERQLQQVILDNLNVGVILLDNRGTLLTFNKTVLQWYGYGSESEMRQHSSEYISEFELHDSENNEIPFEKWPAVGAVKGEYVKDLEVKLTRKKTGDSLWVNFTTVPVLDSRNEVVHILMSMSDVTMRKQAEQALHRSRRLMAEGEALSQTGAWEWNVNDDRWSFSDEWLAIHGIPQKTLDTEELMTIAHPDDRHIVNQGMEKLQQGTGSYDLEHRIIRQSDGAVRIVHSRGRFIRDESGKVIRVYGFAQDITERRRAEEALRASEARLRKAISAQTVGVLFFSLNGGISGANATFERMSGYSSDELRKIPHWKALTTPEYWDATIRTAENLATLGTTPPYEKQMFRKDGSRWWGLFAPTRLSGSGTNTECIEFIIDITERKRTEEALRAALQKAVTGDRLLAALMDNVPEGISISDTEGIIHIISKHGQELFTGIHSGMSIEEAVRKWKVFRPDGQSVMPTEELPLVRALKGETVRDIEILEVNSDGRRLPLLCNAAPIRDENNEIINGIIVWRDITALKEAQKAMQESESRYRGIFHNAAIGIFQTDGDNRLIAVNDNLCQMLGYSSEELLSMDVNNLTAPEDRQRSEEMNARIHKREMSRASYEKHYLKADGSKLWVNVTVSSIHDESGRHIGSVSTVEDISARKEAEASLRESEASLNKAQEIAHLGSWELDLVENRLSWSDEIYRIFGLKPREFGATYEAFLDHVHPDDREAVDEAYSGSIREGRDVYEIEHRVVRADSGEIRYVHEKCQHMRDAQGHIIKSVGMVHDITERKLAEDAYKESQLRFSKAFHSSPVALSLSSPEEGLILEANETFCRLTGYSHDELIGHTTLELGIVTPELRRQIIEKYYPQGRMYMHETQVYSRDGAMHDVVASADILELKEGRFFLITMMDITERKQAERALEQRTEELAAANRDLESFSYSVSHDLRSPLRTIAGFAEFLSEDYADRLDEEGRDFIRRINESVKKMQVLIDDMLSLSRIGRQEVKREEVDLSAIVRSYLAELQASDPTRQTEFVIQESVHTSADPRLTHLALENLLRNAWKFTAKENVTRIEFGTAVKEGQTVFYVRDNGVGFDMQFARKIFEPFKRVHAEKEFGGTGIGLSIVQRVIEKHGGRVWAQGEVGSGAMFWFTLA